VNERLAGLLAPVAPEVFFEKYEAREHLFITRNLPCFYDGVLRLEDLDTYFQSQVTPAIFFYPVSVGVRSPSDAWSRDRHSARGYDRVAVPERLFNLYSEKTTLILNEAHLSIPPLAQACRELTEELGFRAQANIYITPAESQGFNRHSDNHDVIILQISGRKSWTLYPRGVERVDVEIQRGDLLYIPSGLAHAASCSDDASIHVTVGLHPPYGYQVLQELVAVARNHPEFQRPAPPASASMERKRQFEAAFSRNVCELLAATDVSTLLENRFHALVENQNHGWRGRFLDVLRLPEITPNTVLCVRPEIITRVENRGPKLVLHFAGQKIEVPQFLAGALERVREKVPFAITELPGMMTASGKVGFVRPFVQHGVLSIVKI
jgi:ribosomal protein L16 Arg81 hydroxylase